LALGCLAASPVFAAEPAAAPRAACSIHLQYPAAEAVAFYNEVTIERTTPGSYFAVCGFGHGYFGLQELGNGKKVVIFSVWDPTKGDNRDAVPLEQRVEVLHRGEDVTVKRFGGEGTGGQSFFSFDWQTGQTYRFAVAAAVEGKKTAYAGYVFLPDQKSWKHLVTFRTETGGDHLRGLYSFVEDFRRDSVSAGEVRRATFGNGWALDGAGKWQPLTKAQFTASNAPTEARDLIDAGPTEGHRFYLQNGGDTRMSRKVGSTLEHAARDHPGIAPADLPLESEIVGVK
jgi:hypothetical protein